MKYFLALLLCYLSPGTQAQTVLQIADSLVGRPVPYATIRVQGQHRGYYANEYGRLSGVAFSSTDTLLIGCVGYTSKTVPYASLPQNATVQLKPGHELQEVVVQPFPEAVKMVPFPDRKGIMSFSSHMKMEFVSLVSFPSEEQGKPHLIQDVRIRFKNWDGNNPVRLRIYEAGPDGRPGADLLQKNVVITRADVRGGVLRVDVSQYNVVTTGNAIFAGIEWLGEIDSSASNRSYFAMPRLLMTSASNAPTTYSRILLDPLYAWRNDIFNIDGKAWNMMVSIRYR